MRLLRWLFVSLPLLLLFIATLFWGLLHTIDRTVYQQALEAEISKLTGRAFQVKGTLGIELLPRPALVAGGVNLANAPWGSRKQMLKLGHLRMELALRPLLKGRITITKIVASELDLLLERNAEDEPNWHFKGQQDDSRRKLLGDGFSLWDIHQVLAHKAKLTIKAGNGREPINIEVEALQLRALNRFSPVEIYLKGKALGRSFIFSGAMENMSRLLANKIVAVRGKAIHGNSELSFRGVLEQPLMMGNPRLVVLGKGAELAAIVPDLPVNMAYLPYKFEFSARPDGARWILDGIHLSAGKNNLSGSVTIYPDKEKGRFEALMVVADGPEIGMFFPTLADSLAPLPYQISIEAAGDFKHWDLKKLQLKAGANEVTGSLAVDWGGKRPRIAGELRSTQIELPIGKLNGSDIAVKQKSNAGKLFSSEDIDSAALSWIDGHINLDVELLKNAVLPVKNLHTQLQLEDGQLHVTELRMDVAGGTLTASGRIDDKQSRPIELKASGKELDLLRLVNQFGLDADGLSGKIDFSLVLNAHGHSSATVAKSLNGEVRLLMTKGRVRTEMHEYLVGGLSTVLSTFFREKADTTIIHCAIAHMRFQQGMGKSLSLVVDTEHALLKGEGKLNLHDESLDFLIEPKPKGVTLNLGVPLRIQGPIQEPVVSPQALGAARKIGGLLGIIFFPPAALLGLGELGAGDAPACSKALAGN